MEVGAAEGLLKLKVVQTIVKPELDKEGFAVPARRSLEEALTAGLEALPRKTLFQKGRPAEEGVALCSFAHLLNLFWVPVVEYVDSLTPESAPDMTQALALNQAVLVAEMAGTVPGADETLDIDSWLEFIRDYLLKLLEVHVPLRLISQVMSPVVPFCLAPTRANALHLLRSSRCSQLVGTALATQVSREILAEVAEVPVQLCSEQDLALEVRRNLIGLLEKTLCDPEEDEDLDQEPLRKKQRSLQARKEQLQSKTTQVLFMLQNRLCVSRAQGTLESAAALLQNLSSSSSSGFSQVEDELFGAEALRMHLLFLDGAMDRNTSEVLMGLREEERLAGVAVATDESPPNQPRFRGLRFQITVIYWGTFQPLSDWEASSDPPVHVMSSLGDIMHCPGKKGVDVSRILEKQLARVGLNCFDVVSGTGDGGGENEGHQGVHSYFENLNPGYVRRRCLPHIAWRTCDVAIRASNLDYRALAAYMVEGITWNRLRSLATTTRANGGLELFSDGSEECKMVFGNSPSAIIETRPDTDLTFLKLLDGKEHILHRIAMKVLEQRSLGAEARASIMNLGDMQSRIQRKILKEILCRCMFLHLKTAKHPTVASYTSWDELLQEAVAVILSLDITAGVLEGFNMTQEDLERMDPRPKTWVELAVLGVVGDEDLVAEKMQEALEFHKSVSGQAAAHLNLLADNTYRTPWLAAKLLSKDPALAREAARTLVRHLVTTRPNNRTSFEEHLFTQEELWRNLEGFSQAEPAVLLWKGHGRYECLFKFLAPRFLLAPDHVIDAERVHARWQWISRRGVRTMLPTMNATLRLQFYMEHNQGFPSHEDLLPHLQAERLAHRVALESLEEIALGWRLLDKTNKEHECTAT